MKNTIAAFLLLISCTGRAQVYDQELEKERNHTRAAFLQLMPRISDRLWDSTLTPEQQVALFDPMLVYIQKCLPAYRKIRQKYLEESPAPPSTLFNLHFHSLQDSDQLAKILYDPKYSAATLLYCYKPAEISAVINGFIQPLLIQKAGISFTEASIGYTFGQQVFTKKLKGDQWQIWSASRAYVLRFIFDLNNSTIQHLEFTAFNDPEYVKIQLPFSAYKPRFTTDQLYLSMSKIRWDAYTTNLIKNVPPHSWQDTVNRRLLAYYAQNQEQFHMVRQKILAGLDKAGLPDTSWKEFTNLLPEDTESLKEVLVPYFIEPGAIADYLFSATHTIPHFSKNIEEIGANTMTGFQNSVISNNGAALWKICSRSYSVAFEYTWNIQTGEVTGLRLLKRS
ncbi:hypothetical protein A8C56_05270 [Niabella ginsenosidivorans]|uniref:Uncharacterized protein n=1 Tax=Niabella ginsenosidivorans TaxID=1176587 RepID=A0A1A9I080_9BACT|nr:hypothetical protein [Niabella ginsenosidivorans]ANH80479.1 hypothetical protein A8C56_05270 [Niabella ginsenosidivorans]